jgi:hypothetical protein
MEMLKTLTSLSLGVMAVAGALALSPVAQAAEPLTSAQMDAVTAGYNYVYFEAYVESNQYFSNVTLSISLY